MTSPAAIEDKSPKPPGLLPKNVQSWLLVGLAVVMVLIMWLTGGKKPPASPRNTAPVPPVPVPLEVNDAKIVELQNRIQQLQREQIVAENALAQQTRAMAADSEPQLAAAGNAAPAEPPEDPISQ